MVLLGKCNCLIRLRSSVARLGWVLIRKTVKDWVKTPLRFQNTFWFLSFHRGSGGSRRGGSSCCARNPTSSECSLGNCVLFAWLPEAWNSSARPPCSSSITVALKGQAEVAGVGRELRQTGSVGRDAAWVDSHAAGRPILPVDVARQQRGGALLVRRWRAVTHTLFKFPVHPPVVGHVLYGGPLVRTHSQQPVDKGAGVWRGQSQQLFIAAYNEDQQHSSRNVTDAVPLPEGGLGRR